MEYIILAYIVCIYISIPGLVSKAGGEFLLGLIPIVNIFILAKLLKINIIIVILLLLCLIFLKIRMFFVTLIIVFLPFVVCDAYGKNIIYSLLCLVCPFLMFPLLAYGPSDYAYD